MLVCETFWWAHTHGCTVHAVQVVVMVRPTVSLSPGDSDSVLLIWVKVTVDFNQMGGCAEEGRGWLIHIHLPTPTGAPLLCVPVIGLGGSSGGYLMMWRLLNKIWI